VAWSADVREAAARADAIGRYRLRGDGTDMRVRAALHALSLPALEPWLPVPSLRAGLVSGTVEHRWSSGRVPRHLLRADLGLTGLDAGDDPRVSARTVRLGGLRVDLARRTAALASLRVDGAEVRFASAPGSPSVGTAGAAGWQGVVRDATVA